MPMTTVFQSLAKAAGASASPAASIAPKPSAFTNFRAISSLPCFARFMTLASASIPSHTSGAAKGKLGRRPKSQRVLIGRAASRPCQRADPGKDCRKREEFQAMRRILRVVFAVGAPAAPALAFADDSATNGAIDNAFGEHAKYERVILSLQKAVVAHDSAAVANLVRYPISVSIGGRKTMIQNAKTFLANYGAIMTPDIVSTVKTQKYEDLF